VVALSLKTVIKLISPPIILILSRRIMNYLSDKKFIEWECLTGSWRTDVKEIRGWDERSVVEAQLKSWKKNDEINEVACIKSTAQGYRLLIFSYVISRIALEKEKTFSLLDYGGGLGQYYIYLNNLYPDLRVDYIVKERDLLCQYAIKNLPEVKFISSDEVAFNRTYDLIFCSSTLQYQEDWKCLFRKMISASDRYIYIARLPVVNNTKDFIVIQRPYSHGYDTEFLIWVFNKKGFIAWAEMAGLTLVKEFIVSDHPFINGAKEQGMEVSLLFEKSPS